MSMSVAQRRRSESESYINHHSRRTTNFNRIDLTYSALENHLIQTHEMLMRNIENKLNIDRETYILKFNDKVTLLEEEIEKMKVENKVLEISNKKLFTEQKKINGIIKSLNTENLYLKSVVKDVEKSETRIKGLESKLSQLLSRLS